MTGYSDSVPSRVYTRRDPEVDPPGLPIGLDLDQHIVGGGVVLFVDHGAEPTRAFELHRLNGAFRITDGIAPPHGCFASPEAAIRAGWAMVDAGVQVGGDSPPAGALLSISDPDGDAT